MKICANCFNDKEIKNFIISTSNGKKNICDCCKKKSAIIEIEELLDEFDELISVFKKDETNGIPLIELIQNDLNFFSSTECANQIINEVVNKVQNKENIDEYTRVSYIDEILDCVKYWDELKETIKHKRRFILNSNDLLDLEWDSLLSDKIPCDSNTIFYRARIHNEKGKVFNKADLDAPPKEICKGGRANPEGIPYLYLCKDLETTLYETRSTYTDEISVGHFKILDGETLYFADFTEDNYYSIFKGNITNNIKRKLLKRHISEDLSKPMRRFDSKLEYIPTQFICEFIRFYSNADGIQFNSSIHRNGINVVVFSKDKLYCDKIEKLTITGVQINHNK